MAADRSRGTVRRVHARTALAVLPIAATLAVGGVAPADVSPETQANTTKAEQLVDRFFDVLAPDTPTPKLEKLLSPAFVLQRADGTSADKATYVEDPAVVESYEVSDLTATRTGPVLVARYTVVVDSTIDGQRQRGDPAPRLSVFVKGKDGWQIVAHSNFNMLVSDTTTTTT